MENELLIAARKKIHEGFDILYLRLFLEEELASWKRSHIKYKNSPTEIVQAGNGVVMRHRTVDLVEFIRLV